MNPPRCPELSDIGTTCRWIPLVLLEAWESHPEFPEGSDLAAESASHAQRLRVGARSMTPRSLLVLAKMGPADVQSTRAIRLARALRVVHNGQLYHQLPHHGLVKVLRTDIDSLSHEVTPIHMFLPHAAFSLLFPSKTLSLQAAGLAVLLRFSARFQRCQIPLGGTSDPQEREISPAGAMVSGTFSPAVWRRTGVGQSPLSLRRRSTRLPRVCVPHDAGMMCIGAKESGIVLRPDQRPRDIGRWTPSVWGNDCDSDFRTVGFPQNHPAAQPGKKGSSQRRGM